MVEAQSQQGLFKDIINLNDSKWNSIHQNSIPAQEFVNNALIDVKNIQPATAYSQINYLTCDELEVLPPDDDRPYPVGWSFKEFTNIYYNNKNTIPEDEMLQQNVLVKQYNGGETIDENQTHEKYLSSTNLMSICDLGNIVIPKPANSQMTDEEYTQYQIQQNSLLQPNYTILSFERNKVSENEYDNYYNIEFALPDGSHTLTYDYNQEFQIPKLYGNQFKITIPAPSMAMDWRIGSNGKWYIYDTDADPDELEFSNNPPTEPNPNVNRNNNKRQLKLINESQQKSKKVDSLVKRDEQVGPIIEGDFELGSFEIDAHDIICHLTFYMRGYNPNGSKTYDFNITPGNSRWDLIEADATPNSPNYWSETISSMSFGTFIMAKLKSYPQNSDVPLEEREIEGYNIGFLFNYDSNNKTIDLGDIQDLFNLNNIQPDYKYFIIKTENQDASGNSLIGINPSAGTVTFTVPFSLGFGSCNEDDWIQLNDDTDDMTTAESYHKIFSIVNTSQFDTGLTRLQTLGPYFISNKFHRFYKDYQLNPLPFCEKISNIPSSPLTP